MITFTENSLFPKHLNIYDLTLLYNNFMGYIESGAMFPFCKKKTPCTERSSDFSKSHS